MFLILKLSHLRNSEFVQFFVDLLAIFTKHNPTDLHIEKPYQDLKDAVAVLREIFNPKKGSNITEELAELDGERDGAFNGISLVIEGFSYSYNPAIRDAALLLMDSLESFKGAVRLNYSAETSTLSDLVSKWRVEPYAGALTTLGQTHWIDRMDVVNNHFNERFLARVEEEANSPEIKMKAQRDTVTKLYGTLLKRTDAYATINGPEGYEDLANEVNVLIQSYDKMLNARKADHQNTNAN